MWDISIVDPVQGGGEAFFVAGIQAGLEGALQAVFQMAGGLIAAFRQNTVIHDVSAGIGVADETDILTLGEGFLMAFFTPKQGSQPSAMSF